MDFNDLIQLFHKLRDVEYLVTTGGLLVLIIIIFSETGLLAGFFLPGDSLLVTTGIFVALGRLDANIWTVLITLSIAAVLGDATGYAIGRKAGQTLYSRPDSMFFKKAHLMKAKSFYDKYGGKTIVLARFVPIIRTFAPTVAGAAEMPYRKFATYNIFGGISWIFSMTLLGYFLGKAFPEITKRIETVIIVVVFISILPAVIEYLRERAALKKAQAQGEVQTEKN
ncbi:MAG: VTT domain-containing protein [Blastocatellia bacterium]|nr:VTT domain-containing protein [Blastocatellia bacterium]MBN8722455.1 VTT domain-containing protein [Acidobacteriota bacterium]